MDDSTKDDSIVEECFHQYRNASIAVCEVCNKFEKELRGKLLELGLCEDDVDEELKLAFSGLILLHDKYHSNMHMWRAKRKASDTKSVSEEKMKPMEEPSNSNKKELKKIADDWRTSASEGVDIWDGFLKKIHRKR